MKEQMIFEFEDRPDAKDAPELCWAGKRPYRSTQYFPARLRERYGEEQNGWRNKIFWGDNLQVMSHLLKEYRGKVDLIYIDPPFNSNAEYKKKIELKGTGKGESGFSWEETQYEDVWTNEEYLQFLYERLILCRELLSQHGSIYVHLDENRSHYIKVIMDEIFGRNGFKREIIWRIGWVSGYKSAAKQWIRNHDVILYYTKSREYTFHKEYIPYPEGYVRRDGAAPAGQGYPIEDTWNCSELDPLHSIQIMSFSGEKVGYPTQKNENLLARIIRCSSDPGDLVFDCFMGSGTTQAVAMKLGRRFLGADSNLGAVQTTTKRLLSVIRGQPSGPEKKTRYPGFEVYHVGREESFREEAEAEIVREDGKLVIRAFSPKDLLKKLPPSSEQKIDWRRLVGSVRIDWDYDGAVLQPAVIDMPGKGELVSGVYEIPENAGTIRVRITDLLSRSLEVEM